MSLDEFDTLEDESKTLLHDASVTKTFHRKRPQLYLWFLQLVLLTISVSLLLFTYNTASHQDCIRTTSVYSPALDALKEGYRIVQFNGSLSAPSPYKGPPNSDVDAAWKSIAESKFRTLAGRKNNH